MTLADLASIATVLGIALVAAQLWMARLLARTSFEDQIGSHYRELLREIPVEALLNADIDLDDARALGPFYRYVDLCNEQIFLRTRGRISRPTWCNWADGMRKQFERPAFKGAWTKIHAADQDSFQELRRAEREGFNRDPANW